MPVLRTSMFVAAPERTVLAALSELDSVRIPWLLRGGSLSGSAKQTGTLTLLVCTVDWPRRGRVWDFVFGTLLWAPVLRALDRACERVRRRAQRLAELPVVVGAAVRDGGRLLAQQRAYPAAVAGQWELPGGRVEPGESEVDAVIRECREELGVPVRVGARVGPDVPLGTDLVLRVYAAELAEHGAVPEAKEHRAVRWLTRAELTTADWLDADQALVPALQALLAPHGGRE